MKMAISSFVMFTILGSGVVAVGSLIFSFIMIANFSKKKTMGTALLAVFYGFIAIYHIIHSAMITMAATNSYSTTHKILFIAYITTLFLSYYFLYIFGCRHILPDNELVKSIIVMVMFTVNVALIFLMAYELFFNVAEPIFYVVDTKPDINHYVPNIIVTVIIYLTTVLFVEWRIIFRLSVMLIKKEVEDQVQRKGLQRILYGILSLFGATLITILVSIPNLNSTIFIFLYILRGICTLLALYLSYVGWILPDWYVRRIRKAWIVTKVRIGEEVQSSFISSDTYRSNTNVTEISEQ